MDGVVVRTKAAVTLHFEVEVDGKHVALEEIVRRLNGAASNLYPEFRLGKGGVLVRGWVQHDGVGEEGR